MSQALNLNFEKNYTVVSSLVADRVLGTRKLRFCLTTFDYLLLLTQFYEGARYSLYRIEHAHVFVFPRREINSKLELVNVCNEIAFNTILEAVGKPR